MPATPSNANVTAEHAELSRRDFLTLTWKGLLALSGLMGLGGLARFLSFQPEPAPPTAFDIGLASEFPPGVRATIKEAQAVLISTQSGFQAFSLVCPHLGCTVELSEAGYACPCHGSRFHRDGTLERGPADKNLTPLRVEQTSQGHLIVHTD